MRIQLVIFVIIATVAGLSSWPPDIAGEAREAVNACVVHMQKGNWQGSKPYLFAVSSQDCSTMPEMPSDWLKEICQKGQFGPASLLLDKEEYARLARLTHKRMDLQAFAQQSGYIALAKKNGTWQIVACRHLGEPLLLPGSNMVWDGLEMGKIVMRKAGTPEHVAWQELGHELSQAKPVAREIATEHVIPVVDKKPERPVTPEQATVEPQPPVADKKPEVPVLTTKKCIFQFNNRVEPENPVSMRVTIKDTASGEVRVIQEEMELPLSRYELDLQQEGYKAYREEITVDGHPGEPVFFHYTFEPLPRQLLWFFKSDYPEGEELQPDKITVNGESVVQPTRLQPGVCQVEASKDGYATWREQILVKASSKPYFLSSVLRVREREFSLEIIDRQSNQKLIPDKITIQGETVVGDRPVMLKPGEYELAVTIAGYQTATRKVAIPAGSGLYRLPFFMAKTAPATANAPDPVAAPYTMLLHGETIVLDGITYGYEFSSDDHPLPPQSVGIQHKGEKTIATIAVPESAKVLSIAAGYFYNTYTLPQLPEQLEEFNYIALEAWKGHFEKLFRQAGKESTVDALASFFSQESNVKKIKDNNDVEALKDLVMYIQDWPIPPQLLKQIEDSLYQEKK
jgi:hypothetical protein